MLASSWDMFFQEQDWSPDARKDINVGAPLKELQIDGDWEAIIAASRPYKTSNEEFWSKYREFGGTPEWPAIRAAIPPHREYEDSLFGFHRKWLGAWLPRCVPDGNFARRALKEARLRLRQEMIRMHGNEAKFWFQG